MGLGSFSKSVSALFSNLSSKDNLYMSKDKKIEEYVVLCGKWTKKKSAEQFSKKRFNLT